MGGRRGQYNLGGPAEGRGDCWNCCTAARGAQGGALQQHRRIKLGKSCRQRCHSGQDLLSIGQFLLKQRQLKTVVFGELEDVKRTEDVDGMGDEVDIDIISTVKGVLTQQRESLQEVALWGKYLRAPPLDPLVNPLVTCQRLTSFELAWSALSLQSLLAVVERLHNLRALSLVGIILSNEAALTASDALLVASSVEHHPHLRELTVKLCSVFLVKGGVEGMTRRHGVEKLVITPFMQRRASTVDPALVPPICATMRRGSLKTLGIGELSKPDHVVQVLEELSHCTQLRELELKLKIPQLDLDLSQSDEVVTLPSAVEAGLSKCTTLQKLTVRGSTSSVTAAFLKGVTVSRSLKEVKLAGCNYDGIDNKVAFFLSDLKQAPQLRKIEMTDCQYLSPSLIATVCGGLYTSNSIEEVEVTLWRFTSKVEDVLDTDLLKAVEAAVKSSLSMKRIKIQGEFIKWTNVATAILKGAAQSTSLRELELETPEEFPPPQEVIDDVRKAKPELRLVVMSGNNCSCFSTYL